MLSSKEYSLRQRAVEWNKETKRLMDLEIYGGGGIEPNQFDYPDERFVQDNEIYLFYSKYNAYYNKVGNIRISRIAVAGGGGVVAEIGYIDHSSRRFINKSKEWGYGPYGSFANGTQQSETFEIFERDGMVNRAFPINLGLQYETIYNSIPTESICIRLTPSNSNRGFALDSYFTELIINRNYVYHAGTSEELTITPENTRYVSMCVMKASKLQKVYITDSDYFYYFVMYGNYQSYFDWSFANNANLHYLLMENILELSSNTEVVVTEYGRPVYGKFALCTHLYRTPYIDFENVSGEYSLTGLFMNCWGLTINNISIIDNTIRINGKRDPKIRLEFIYSNLSYGLILDIASDVNEVDCSYMFVFSASKLPVIHIHNPNVTITNLSSSSFAPPETTITKMEVDTRCELLKYASSVKGLFSNMNITKVHDGDPSQPGTLVFSNATDISSLFYQTTFDDGATVKKVDAPQAIYAQELFFKSNLTKLPIVNLPKAEIIYYIFAQTQIVDQAYTNEYSFPSAKNCGSIFEGCQVFTNEINPNNGSYQILTLDMPLAVNIHYLFCDNRKMKHFPIFRQLQGSNSFEHAVYAESFFTRCYELYGSVQIAPLESATKDIFHFSPSRFPRVENISGMFDSCYNIGLSYFDNSAPFYRFEHVKNARYAFTKTGLYRVKSEKAASAGQSFTLSFGKKMADGEVYTGKDINVTAIFGEGNVVTGDKSGEMWMCRLSIVGTPIVDESWSVHDLYYYTIDNRTAPPSSYLEVLLRENSYSSDEYITRFITAFNEHLTSVTKVTVS